MDVNVERWLPVLGVLALFVFEVFLMTWGAEAIADRMLSEIEKHPEITALLNDPEFVALQNAAANVLAVVLLAAIVGLLAWGIYETAVDAARDSLYHSSARRHPHLSRPLAFF